jgi:hypothetical protein
MKWGRGFFRLWLVLSVLWALAAGGLWWQAALAPIAYITPRVYDIVAKTGLPEVIPDPSPALDALTAAKTAGQVKEVEIAVPPGHPNLPTSQLFVGADWDSARISTSVDLVAASLIAEESAQIETLGASNKVAASEFILAPPIVLLALGAALGWVLVGFRRGSNRAPNS